MALGEPEIGEGLDLAVDLVGDLTHDSVALHPLVQPLTQRLDTLDPALRTHGAAQQVGIFSGASAHSHCHLHQLLLEHGNTEGTREGLLELRMQVGDGLLPKLAPHIGVHGPSLDGTGPNKRDLYHQVVETAGLQPGEQPHLGPGFHLEHPDRIGAAQHVVDAGLLLRNRLECPLLTDVFAHQVEAVLEGGEHPQAQQVELDEPHPGAVVFVPLQHGAPIHSAVLDRADLAHRTIGEHHSTGVDAQVPGKLQDFVRQVDDRSGDVVVVALGEGTPAFDLLRPGILLAGAVSQRFRHVAYGIFRPVTDDVGDLCRILPSVLRIDILDDLLTTVRIEVDIDVGFFVAHARQEPLERQVVVDRVDRRDLQQEADSRIRCRTAPLAEDAQAPGITHDVPHDQEVAGKVFLLDDPQLLFDALPIFLLQVRVSFRRAIPDQLAQPAHRCVAFWHILFGKTRPGPA